MLNRILSKGLMRVFQLPNFIPFQVNFSHFAMVIRQLLIVIVVGWLLVLLNLVYRLLRVCLLLGLWCLSQCLRCLNNLNTLNILLSLIRNSIQLTQLEKLVRSQVEFLKL